jgi:hypothetical protein
VGGSFVLPVALSVTIRTFASAATRIFIRAQQYQRGDAAKGDLKMWHRYLLVGATLAWLTACTTPYRPPVIVHDSDEIPGIVPLIANNGKKPLDIVLIHGMCSHDTRWARSAIDNLARTIDPGYAGSWPDAPPPPQPNRIGVVTRTAPLAGGTVRFTALVWSPLTAPLKQRLDYDATSTPNDCSQPGNTEANCKPRRAYFNGRIKDSLMNDCLTDAMIYEGFSHTAIRNAMVQTLKRVIDEQDAKSGGNPGPLVVVSESLGSKLVFDSLNHMLSRPKTDPLALAGQRAAARLGLVFMAGNPLPILGLADDPHDKPLVQVQLVDSLQRFLVLRRSAGLEQRKAVSKLKLVAFTDPNDLLSYRLLRADYVSADVDLANVLVSNRPTYFGLLEDPLGAHLGYLTNPDVDRLIVQGWSRSGPR